MKRPEKIMPEKRIAKPLCEISFNKGRVVGNNQTCDDWESYLKEVEHIALGICCGSEYVGDIKAIVTRLVEKVNERGEKIKTLIKQSKR